MDIPSYKDMEATQAMKCPSCGTDNVHIEKVCVVQGPRITTVTVQGVDDYISRETASFSGRGSMVVMTMFCEEGHAWDIRFQFHKGQTFWGFCDVRRVPEDVTPSELWRD